MRSRSSIPVWDLLLVPERFRILHLLLESVGYDGATGELELGFYPLGITTLAAEAARVGRPNAEATWMAGLAHRKRRSPRRASR